jgi:hypothetical protein
MSSALTSHRKDLDGISSAALMVRYFTKHRPLPFFLTLKDYGDGPSVIDDRLLNTSGFELYISDLATDQKFIQDVIERLRRIKSNGNKITWMDHHPTRPEIIRDLHDVVDVLDLRPSTITGSMIVFDRLYSMNGIEDPHAKMISSLGRDSDLMENRFPVTGKLVTLIDYYNYLDADSFFHPNLIHLALHLAFPKVESDLDRLLEPYQVEQVKSYERMKEAERERVLSHVETVSVGQFRFAVFEYPKIFSGSAICNDVLKDKEFSGCVGFTEDGSGSVRRNDDRVSCRSIAQLLGGGGHEFAAGFNLGFKLETEEDRRRARSIIIQKLHEVYQG